MARRIITTAMQKEAYESQLKNIKSKIEELENKIASKKQVIKETHRAKLELEKEIAVSKYGQVFLTVEDAISHKSLPAVEYKLVCCEVGGEYYHFVTKQDVNFHLDQIIAAAKSGDQKPLSVMLREWGFVYHCEVVQVLNNEVEALLAMRIQQNKFNPVENESASLVGDEFRLIRTKNQFDEIVWGVSVAELEDKVIELDCLQISLEDELAVLISQQSKTERDYRGKKAQYESLFPNNSASSQNNTTESC